MSEVEASEITRLRQGLYRILAGTLADPGDEHLATLEAAAQYLHAFPIEDFEFFGPWRRLERELASGLDPAVLGVEYVRLFASGTDGALCPPTESFYVSRAEGGGIAEAIAAVRRTYAELGLSVVDWDSPDHVTSELNAMSRLCGQEADAWLSMDVGEARRLLAREHLFLRVHLMAWFPQFHARLVAAARGGFYRVAGDAVRAFLVHDVDWTRTLASRLEVE